MNIHNIMVDYQNKVVDILMEAGVKKSRDEVLADIDREFWLNAEEAVDYGLADKVLESKTWNKWIGGD